MSKTATRTTKFTAMSLSQKLIWLIKWVLILFFALYTLFPILWLAMTALKTNAEYFSNPFSLPAIAQWNNFVYAFTAAKLGVMALNSVIISFGATFANVLVSAMCAYGIARYRFRGREILFALFSMGIMIPLNAFLLPYYLMYSKTGMLDSLPTLQLLYLVVGLPMSIFIIRGFMDTVPNEIEEAAVVDGCSFAGRFFRIILPLTKNGLVTAGTFAFVTYWNEFVFANLMLSSPDKRTIQIGVRWFMGQFATDYVSLYAAIVIAMMPSILIYIIFQEQIISGLTVGAVKG